MSFRSDSSWPPLSSAFSGKTTIAFYKGHNSFQWYPKAGPLAGFENPAISLGLYPASFTISALLQNDFFWERTNTSAVRM